MQRSYETMYILRPDLSDEQIEEVMTRFQSWLSERGGQDIQVQNRGKRRLAYPIKRHTEGIYIQTNYTLDGSQIAPFERALRLSDEVIRYLTLKTEASPSEAPAEEEVATGTSGAS